MLTPVSRHDFRVTFVVRARVGRDADPDQIGRLVAHVVRATSAVVAVRVERDSLFFELMPPDDAMLRSLAEYGAQLRAMVRSFLEAEKLPVDAFEMLAASDTLMSDPMIDYGVEELLGRRGRKLLAECRQEARGFRLGVEELPGGPTYVCRAIVGGVELAEGLRVRDCCRARLYPGLPPRPIGDELEILLCSILEAIREVKAA